MGRLAEIVRTDGVLGGEPRIVGTRVGVLHVFELTVDGGHEPADVADQLDRSLAEVYSGRAYFHGLSDEMREVRPANDAAEEELAERSLGPPRTAEQGVVPPDRRARSGRFPRDASGHRTRGRRSRGRFRDDDGRRAATTVPGDRDHHLATQDEKDSAGRHADTVGRAGLAVYADANYLRDDPEDPFVPRNESSRTLPRTNVETRSSGSTSGDDNRRAGYRGQQRDLRNH